MPITTTKSAFSNYPNPTILILLKSNSFRNNSCSNNICFFCSNSFSYTHSSLSLTSIARSADANTEVKTGEETSSRAGTVILVAKLALRLYLIQYVLSSVYSTPESQCRNVQLKLTIVLCKPVEQLL